MEDATGGFRNEQGGIWWFRSIFYFSSNSYPVDSSWKKIISSSIGIHIWGKDDFFSIFLVGGDAYPAVPYLLPCVVLTFYLLGRAAWDWP